MKNDPDLASVPAKPGPFKPAKPTKEKPQPVPAAGMSGDGLIKMADEEKAKAIQLIYCKTGKWHAPTAFGGWMPVKDSHAATMVAEYGFSKTFKNDAGNSAADRTLMYLAQNRCVDYAGSLAGYQVGLHTLDGVSFLVTDSPRLIKPKRGPWPIIRRLIETQLKDATHDQKAVFYTWLAASYGEFWERMTTPGPWQFRFCPALCIFGPKECGKSALINLLLLPLFGGRKANPLPYFSEGRFNKDLFGAPLLVMDDAGAGASLAERRLRGERMKSLLWSEEQRMEGKGADALNLKPFWRMVVAGNDDDAGLQVAPALSRSMEDKLIILRAVKADGLPTTNEENDKWTAAIKRELPHFAASLLSYNPPETIELNDRSRVAIFKHPALVSALRQMQPEMVLLELIDQFKLVDPDRSYWEGSASEFVITMRGKDDKGVLDRVITSITAAGRHLTELSRIVPQRVTATDHMGISHYRIFRPPSE